MLVNIQKHHLNFTADTAELFIPLLLFFRYFQQPAPHVRKRGTQAELIGIIRLLDFKGFTQRFQDGLMLRIAWIQPDDFYPGRGGQGRHVFLLNCASLLSAD